MRLNKGFHQSIPPIPVDININWAVTHESPGYQPIAQDVAPGRLQDAGNLLWIDRRVPKRRQRDR
ncbi:hypothetical protein [Sulfobacillus harzensis]|uniref:Uncharacterized protein n=1 Tax=Sulfobacillus harzensis TaxID=2729629 RepID=A0A7Y0L6X6_9FIRM|nr:hypothetical protein [Sulfobacillus harzensis]NMP24449.1 hypothetical protein [Sulfobacillus harzensis]